ncbi:uncharacterized protein HaLaN_26244 [Haematococcus lacustris]|uniref:Uncharacterized protein n=1 Tax=Haematococcus lacustris TaxID=44745 RepID=A0A6A0A5T3_HAELA|nr:uncharacterized protein HaLaN_26244 [Haematococcus lacustris]
MRTAANLLGLAWGPPDGAGRRQHDRIAENDASRSTAWQTPRLRSTEDEVSRSPGCGPAMDACQRHPGPSSANDRDLCLLGGDCSQPNAQALGRSDPEHAHASGGHAERGPGSAPRVPQRERTLAQVRADWSRETVKKLRRSCQDTDGGHVQTTLEQEPTSHCQLTGPRGRRCTGQAQQQLLASQAPRLRCTWCARPDASRTAAKRWPGGIWHVTSALVASEWYMRNNFFPGWARPYEFAAELFTRLKREEEARDMGRVALRLPWWTLQQPFDQVAAVARFAGRTPEEVRYALSEEAAAAAQAQGLGRTTATGPPKTEQQLALERAASLLDMVAAGARPDYTSIRGELAEAYRSAGLLDMSNFIEATS